MRTRATPGVIAASCIVAGDDRTRYDNVAITLHWLAVLWCLCSSGLRSSGVLLRARPDA